MRRILPVLLLLVAATLLALVANPTPVFYSTTTLNVVSGQGYYGPFVYGANVFALFRGGNYASPTFSVWSKVLATPSSSWTQQAQPPTFAAGNTAGDTYFDGTKIWYLAQATGTGDFKLLNFNCNTLAWTQVGSHAGGAIWVLQISAILPMPDGTTLVFATNSGTTTIGFFRVSAVGAWSAFVNMHLETGGGPTSKSGIVAVVNNGVGNTAHVMYADSHGAGGISLYYRKVFADNSMSVEQTVTTGLLNIASIGLTGGSGALSGATSTIFNNQMFVTQISTNPPPTFIASTSAWTSSALDDTVNNPTTWTLNLVYTDANPDSVNDSDKNLGGQFIVSGGNLYGLTAWYLYDVGSNIIRDQLVQARWNGATWNTATILSDFQSPYPTLPAGKICAVDGQGWGGGNEAIFASATGFSNGDIGILVDYGITDPGGGNCPLNGFNISYYEEVGAAIPPSKVAQNYIMSDNPNFGQSTGFIRSN